ncbi:related to POP5 Protein required for processing of tRNAs and rRNAs [Cephalotrichum gorgonifer]|uniref:Ribonuclease P/MRP protein subunit POP5 n=1 Tax=Cephalotrichum gorgonifer TaxID=2041049 RepID=A0AAE8MTX9_9PEZI|nr:related to POP5 Protein required for processing of tRNAs and rRNAs [Cephalotrichum gorgonifer]
MVRTKERYLLVNILYPPDTSRPAPANVPDYVALHRPTVDHVNAQTLSRGIKSAVATLFGDYGLGATESNLSVKYLSRATSTFIIKTSRTHYRLVWAALTFMDQVPVPEGSTCIFRVVHVSGTIRKAEQEAVKRARKLILEARDDAAASSSATLTSLFGQNGGGDEMMVDESDDSVGEEG